MYRWNPTLHELQITRVSDVLLIVSCRLSETWAVGT
jgi:hypothetical protein